MKKVEIWADGRMVGMSTFSREESLHFESAPICAAKVALADGERESMGLGPDDEITVVVNE